MRRRTLSTNIAADETQNTLVRYRIDPEIAHVLLSVKDPGIKGRQADFWDGLGPEYADIARNLAYKVATLRSESGDLAANTYLEAATTILEAIDQQDDLNQKLAI